MASSWRSGPSPPVPRPRGQAQGPTSDKNRGQGLPVVESVYCETVVSMVSMLSCADSANAHRALLAMTNSPESCQALRKAGCIPLLIQILHPTNLPAEAHPSAETRSRAARALKNIVQFNCEEKGKRKELRVLKLLEAIRSYTEHLKTRGPGGIETEKHPVPSSTTLMKLSFDEEHRNTMCLLGAIHALADLLQTDHAAHGINQNPECVVIRRYSGMTLTNLTFGDGTNKALLCSMKDFMAALVAQLDSTNEDVCQVTSSVLRNLSWHADSASRAALRESGAVTSLTNAAIKASKESTLKATLSALWNLSAHSASNKNAICRTPNAIEFLIGLMSYKSKTLTIVENAGGILRNVSTIIVTDEVIRAEFRSFRIFSILLDHLKSSSLTVVSNACGMLWHLSSNSEPDQRELLELGAVPKLKALIYSKHERIAQGAGAALRNLLTCAPEPPPEPLPRSQVLPMDLRTCADEPVLSRAPATRLLTFSDEPLDLSLHSTKSTPIHVVSATEFGSSARPPPFLNPPLQTSSTRQYYSPKNYNSCPEFMRFIPPAHQSAALDFSKSETAAAAPDTTTDYSLHYTESEDSPAAKSEDTVKTYCCEGTPLNFSTSNSMTDLTQVERPGRLKPIRETERRVGPEDEPRKYCTEHTPATFSRASSLSSIASNIQGGENKAEYVEETPPKLTVVAKEKVKRNVTFSANETPLMFSRCSSVNSLDSVDINYEDAGSVASEFSRRASEVVSPSELPDSPRQIGPSYQIPFAKKEASVRRDAAGKEEDVVRVFAKSGESQAASGMQSVRSLSPLTIDGETVGINMKLDSPSELKGPKPIPEPEAAAPAAKASGPARAQRDDEPRVFEVEGTPFGISTATSLSDLMSEIDKDEEKPAEPEPEPPAILTEVTKPTPLTSATPPPAPSPIQPEPQEPIYTDAQMLAKCIKAGRAARIPKSKSELSRLNTKGGGGKSWGSYHEDSRREPQAEIDPELAALIMKGKNRVRSSRALPPKNPLKHIEVEKVGPRVKVLYTDIPEKLDLGSEKKVIEQQSGPKTTISNGQGGLVGKASVSEQSRPKVSMNGHGQNGPKVNMNGQGWTGPKVNVNEQSVLSLGSEWNEDPCSLSMPSISINTAFRMAMADSASNLEPASTLSNIEAPSGFSALVSSTGCRRTPTESNIANQKPPPDLDLENSMISVASLQSEIASIGILEDGLQDLTLGGNTYTIGGGSDGTDVEESINEDTASLGELRPLPADGGPERFMTFTAKRHSSSPRQKRRDDPTRYLTRTISPHSPGWQSSPPGNFSTFRVDRSPRISKPIAATSNESSPSGSPRGIRGRRKPLYASLPPQRKSGPPIPPKPAKLLLVRPTRTSELRAAGSRDISPGRLSSKNSSNNSLNSAPVSSVSRKTPPKPPVRTATTIVTTTSAVRGVRSSNSSIGFSNEERLSESGFNTLPRSLRPPPPQSEGSKVSQKLSSLWNQLTHGGKANSNPGRPTNGNPPELNGNSGPFAPPNPAAGKEKKSKFGFSFGRKKKESIWVRRDEEGPAVPPRDSHSQGQAPPEKEKAMVAPFNYNTAAPKKPEGSKMTTV